MEKTSKTKFGSFLNKIFASFKWYELVFLFVALVTLLTLSCVYKSSIFTILNALLGVVAVFFVAKGMVIGQIVGIIQNIFYTIISYYSHFYGEILVCWLITVPIYAIGIYTWLRNKSKDQKFVNVNKTFKLNEFLIALGVVAVLSIGVYFLLQAFNTPNLLIAVASVVTNMMAGYLIVRRCEYSFVFYIINCTVQIALWTTLIVTQNNSGHIITIAMFVAFFIMNVYGIWNWSNIKKIQKMRKMVLKRKEQKFVMDKDYMKENR